MVDDETHDSDSLAHTKRRGLALLVPGSRGPARCAWGVPTGRDLCRNSEAGPPYWAGPRLAHRSVVADQRGETRGAELGASTSRSGPGPGSDATSHPEDTQTRSRRSGPVYAADGDTAPMARSPEDAMQCPHLEENRAPPRPPQLGPRPLHPTPGVGLNLAATTLGWATRRGGACTWTQAMIPWA